MATTRETLKTNLQSIAKTAPIEEMVQAAQQFKNKADALMKSQLGKDLQSSLAGIKAATIENDYGTTTVDGTGTAFAESVIGKAMKQANELAKAGTLDEIL